MSEGPQRASLPGRRAVPQHVCSTIRHAPGLAPPPLTAPLPRSRGPGWPAGQKEARPPGCRGAPRARGLGTEGPLWGCCGSPGPTGCGDGCAGAGGGLLPDALPRFGADAGPGPAVLQQERPPFPPRGAVPQHTRLSWPWVLGAGRPPRTGSRRGQRGSSEARWASALEAWGERKPVSFLKGV